MYHNQVTKIGKVKLTDFKVLSFDCYGTLIDWEAGLLESLRPLSSQLQSGLCDHEVLESYARHEADQQLKTPSRLYSELMATVYQRLAEEWSIAVSQDECRQFGQSLKNWPAFPDSAESLAYLKEHYMLAILSNVDNESFAASNRKLKVTFDAIYTAQDIGTYKPSDNNFHYLIESLDQQGIHRTEILHTAQSLFHDHVPANRNDLASCWIDRKHDSESSGATPRPAEMPEFDFRFQSLAELVEAHKMQLAG